ncbi:LysR family transcriptional regulator [Vibrio sp. JC009]|uniref:LysR family transcriptional regulator n=1 Tax=Vibrio sp. JC009 TaxID=2912314 RepID=UPI0023B01E72|nr:LysR family transcriptional regulator [Vibrio sp. JC009]WED23804.1 LysR family transcriptional regulator [Vibrio sp. JC009]
MNDSKLLFVFMDVVDQGSFAGAARLRNIDPGQVTKHIKSLESQLGAVLLNRSTRSMSVTEVGEKIYEKAVQMKALLDEVNDIPDEYTQKVQGTVRVTSPEFIGRKYIGPAIRELQAQYPELMFELEITDDRTDLIKEGYDVAIRQWQPKDSNLIATKLRDVELMLVASPDFINTHGNPSSVSELVKLPASVYHRRGFTQDKLRYFNQEQELVKEKLNHYFMANDADLMMQAALSGNSFCLVMDYMPDEYLESGELVHLFPELAFPTELPIYAVYPHRSVPKGARLLVDALRQKLA